MPDLRILVVTRNLPPLLGGMERLNWHMAKEFAKFAAVRVVGPAGAAGQSPKDVPVIEVRLKPLWRFLIGGQWHAWRAARNWNPHWIVAGSGLTAPLVWLAAKACRAQTAVYLHGLDIALDNQLYRCLWLPSMRRINRIIVNSTATRDLAVGVGISPGRISIIHPGVDIPSSMPSISMVVAFLRRHQSEGRPILLSVGRMTRRKGLREFIRDSLPTIVARHPGLRLLIIGDAPSDALHIREESRENIHAVAATVGVADCLRFLGKVDEQELALAYRAADVHVFPIRQSPGDPEGFGMVAIEAAAYGTPTAGYATGGVIDAISDGVSGRLVPVDDTDGMVDAVNELLSTPPERDTVQRYARQFSWDRFGDELGQLFNSSEPARASQTKFSTKDSRDATR